MIPEDIIASAIGHVTVDGSPRTAAALSSARSGEPVPPTIIAFDPSIVDMGYAVLRRVGRTLCRFESGVWHPSKAKGAPDRYVQLARFVACVVAVHAGPVLPRVVVEIPSGGIRPGRVHAMHGYHQAIGAEVVGANVDDRLADGVVIACPWKSLRGRLTSQTDRLTTEGRTS